MRVEAPNFRLCCAPFMDDLLTLLIGNVATEDEERVNENLAGYFNEIGFPVSKEKMANSGTATKILGVGVEGGKVLLKLKKFEKWGPDKTTLTRRIALRIVASIYDPYGMICELTSAGRQLMSELGGRSWDAHLDNVFSAKFWKWFTDIKAQVPREMPRKLDCSNIFVFSDASRLCTGVVFLAKGSDGSWYRLMARSEAYKQHQKGWIASSKLELLGIQRALEWARSIRMALDRVPGGLAHQFCFGTDSETNLQRFANPETFDAITDPWERKVIRTVNNTAVNLGISFFHVDGKHNPADGPSRGCIIEVNAAEAVACAERKGLIVPVRVPTSMNTPGNCEVNDKEQGTKVSAAGVSPNANERTIESLTNRHLREAPGVALEEFIRNLQEKDDRVMALAARVLVNNMWCLYGRQTLEGDPLPRIVVPKELIPNILVEEHDKQGHFGISKTLSAVRDKFYWKNLGRDVRRHIGKCLICQRIKGFRVWNTKPQPLYTDGQPFSTIGMDVVDVSNGLILTITCLYTRYLFGFELRAETSRAVLNILRNVFYLEGFPRVIVCDNGKCFTSYEFQAFLNVNSVSLKYIPRYSPHRGGFYERNHQVLVQTLIATIKEEGSNWRHALPVVLSHVNNRPFEFQLSEEGPLLTPFNVFRGRLFSRAPHLTSTIPTEDLRPNEQVVNDNLVSILAEGIRITKQFEEIWKKLRENSFTTVEKRLVREISWNVGDLVMIYVPARVRTKLEERWSGPYRIEQIVSDSVVIVDGRQESTYNLKKVIASTGNETERDVEPEKEPVRKKRRAHIIANERLGVNSVTQESGVVLLC